MRGTQTMHATTIEPFRITPAYAGNTTMHAIVSGGYRDHPRLCGEHGQVQDKNVVVAGSPPPMRGTLYDLRLAARLGGITPAYAGNT